jgi:hypothetical protein
VCESVLGDLDISKSERRRRAKGLRIMGEIYEKVGAAEYRRQVREEEKKRKEAEAGGGNKEKKDKEKADTESSKDENEEAVVEPPTPSTDDID